MAINNGSYIAQGGADGDRGGKPGTSIPGKQQTPEANPKSPIEERMRNPLGEFSSYTYQITLYMISPGAYNAFVESGRVNINAIGNAQSVPSRAVDSNEGVFIVAQSGGINRQQNRAPYLDEDYYIDDLRIENHITGQSTRSATNAVDIKFKITEPYGFSFLTKTQITGLFSGCCYLHDEEYLGCQGNKYWRGVWLLHEVDNGSFDEMPVSLNYLRKKYEHR